MCMSTDCTILTCHDDRARSDTALQASLRKNGVIIWNI